MTSAIRKPHGDIRILDGGTGSELRRRGIMLSERCWSARANLTHPDLLRTIHEDYIRAGAGIVTANTFATSRFVLAGAGIDAEFAAINREVHAVKRPNLRLAVPVDFCYVAEFDQRSKRPDRQRHARRER